MYVSEISLFKVNWRCSVSFGLILTSEENPTLKIKPPKLFEYSEKYDKKTLRINPSPFIRVSIRNREDDENNVSNALTSFTINRRDLYRVIHYFTSFYKSFQTKDLFYYEDGVLHLNNDIANNLVMRFPCGKKIIHLQHVVVSGKDGEDQYEGCVLAINNFSVCATLTYHDLGYFIFELSHINMEALAMQLLQTSILYESEKTKRKE